MADLASEPKTFVTGAGGRLGSQLVAMGCRPLDCDIASAESVERAIDASAPFTIINCAGYTDVDGAEAPEAEDKAVRSNTTGPGVLRQVHLGYLVHISTGYVFDGQDGPYAEDDEPAPINFYGITKLGGEVMATIRPSRPTLIVRVLDLFGPTSSSDFVQSVLSALETGKKITLPETLLGTPTYIPHLAEAILECIDRGMVGTIHLGGAMTMTRYGWGRKIAEAFGYDPDLIEPTHEISGAAPRPLNASLDLTKASKLGIPIHYPTEGLAEMAKDYDVRT